VAVTTSTGVARADLRWLVAPLPFVAATLGVAAVLSPLAAVVLAGALLFTAIAFHDLAAGVALFTVLTFLETLPGVAGSEVGAVKAAGLVLVFSALRRSGTPFLLREHPGLAFAAVAYATWAVASAAWADDDARAAAYGVRVALGVTLVFVVFAAIRRPAHAQWLIWGYIGGAAASAVVGFFGPTYAGDPARLGGGLGDPNFLAAMLVPAIVLAIFALSWTTHAIQRWILVACVLLFAISLFETQSRGGLVALAATLLAALVLAGPARARFALLVGVLLVVGLVYYSAFAPPQAIERLSSPGGGTGRTDLWSVATDVIADHPLLGVGAGNFPLVAPEYAAHTINLTSVHLVVDTPKAAHNTYLGVASELGVVGLAAFVVVVAVTLVLVWRSIGLFARSADIALELVSRAVLISLIGLLTAFVFLSGETEKPLWLLIGLAIALHGLARRRAGVLATPLTARPPRRLPLRRGSLNTSEALYQLSYVGEAEGS